MKERYNVMNPKAMQVRFHTQTGGSTLTAQQIENNVIRTTIQAMSAVLGGTQSLHTNGKDEALGLPTEQSARTAIRTQQIIAHESGVADTIDPLAGSYFVESLTDELEEQAREYLDKIDELGGAVKAIEADYFQSEIARSAYEYQKAIESGEQVVVGVNKFNSDEEPEPEIQEIDPEQTVRQIKRLEQVRNQREEEHVNKTLHRLHSAARDENVMPLIIEAVKAYATLGEIADTLRDSFGEYNPSV